MNCSECNKCTYDEKMKNLCLDLETRNLLLELIEEGINQQIETIEFLHDIAIDNDVKHMISKGTRMHFDCMLPEMKII
jgi:hypothetical protein